MSSAKTIDHQPNVAQGNTLFPVFLKLDTLRVLLVGAGNVGLEKLSALTANSPYSEIRVVAESISPEVLELAKHNRRINLAQKSFENSDLDHTDLVIVATDDARLNGQIRWEARGRNLLVNVADKPELCDFYLGSVVKKGDLKLGISTNGKSPTLAKRLKEVLDESIPQDINTSIQNLNLVRQSLNGNFSEKVKQLNKVTAVLVKGQQPVNHYKWLSLSIFLTSLFVIGAILWSYEPGFRDTLTGIDSYFYYFLIAGFVAQMIDGALGMAYGVSATTFLLSLGVSPAAASASVHTSEIFTSGVSGLMHLKFGNVSKRLFRGLLLPGVLGAIIGAYALSSLEEYNVYIKPFIGAYTLFLGVKILFKALQARRKPSPVKRVGLLALFGGLMDSMGGGGWGPIVSSTLISKGKNPRFTIGSVNLAEFFVALASSVTFFSVMGISHWQVILGLILGGVIAAPIAARLSSKVPVKALMLMVGVVVIIVSIRIIYVAVF